MVTAVRRCVGFVLVASVWMQFAGAQGFPTDDPVIRKIWKEAVDSSQLESLAHRLFDVIGPRLVGSPQMQKANEWIASTYTGWGMEGRTEAWGKWKGWERGITHIDMLEPRVRTLEGTMLAWSPPTRKGGVTAGIVVLADCADSLAFHGWLPSVKGKFVLVSQPQLTGRPDKDWEEFALKDVFDSLKARRTRVTDAWNLRVKHTGFKADTLPNILERAGAAGVFTCRWSQGYGVEKVFGCSTETMPVVDLALEDYMLLFRLAENGDAPVVHLLAESKFTGPQPTMNSFGTLKGGTKGDEFVMLSAHLGSWDAGSGATDNGTGTLLMLETMRVLKKCYPSPKRTILAGHWGSEEQGLNGSKAFVKDHPEIVEKQQALFNQDNGTGHIVSLSSQGLVNAGERLARWLSRVPRTAMQEVKLDVEGIPFSGGTDNASFVAAGAPGFGLGSNAWNYGIYTWHTNRDTYDKIAFDELKLNVVLTVCLVYMASEDSVTVSRERRVMPVDEKTGQPRPWPEVKEPERAGGGIR